MRILKTSKFYSKRYQIARTGIEFIERLESASPIYNSKPVMEEFLPNEERKLLLQRQV